MCSDIAMASGRPDSTPLRQVRYTAIPSGMLWREMAIMVISPEKATRRLRVALTADSPSMANALRFSLEGTWDWG